MARWRIPVGFDSLTLPEAKALQQRLARLVREEDGPGEARLIAGVDASYDAHDTLTHAAVAIWDAALGRLVETGTATVSTGLPYVPGYLAWRELPAVVAAFEKLDYLPDLVLVDAHGRAHPRRCGLACLVGLALDLPTVGCAKSVLVGVFSGLAADRGSRAHLVDRGEVIGVALRTRTGVRPVFISVGHRVTLGSACSRVLAASRFRIPEPLRLAHSTVTRLCALGVRSS